MKRKKKNKILLTVLLTVCFFICSKTNVYAGIAVPSTVKNIEKEVYSNDAAANVSDLYSNYMFTGVTKMKLQVINNSTTKKLRVYIDAIVDNCVSDVTVPANGTTTWTISTVAGRSYYVRFSAPCDFDWSIRNGN